MKAVETIINDEIDDTLQLENSDDIESLIKQRDDLETQVTYLEELLDITKIEKNKYQLKYDETIIDCQDLTIEVNRLTELHTKLKEKLFNTEKLIRKQSNEMKNLKKLYKKLQTQINFQNSTEMNATIHKWYEKFNINSGLNLTNSKVKLQKQFNRLFIEKSKDNLTENSLQNLKQNNELILLNNIIQELKMNNSQYIYSIDCKNEIINELSVYINELKDDLLEK